MGLLSIILLLGCDEQSTKTNRAPKASSIDIQSNGTALTNSLLTCNTNIFDPDNDPLSLILYWSTEDGNELGIGRTLQLSPELVSPFDVIVCTAEVSDGTHLITDSASIALQNQSPMIDDLSISPDFVTVDSTVTCEITATDNDLDSLAKSIQWFANDNPIGEGFQITLTPELVSKGDTFTCKGVVEDEYGARTEQTTSVTIQNTPPEFSSVSIEPNEPNSQDEVACVPSDVSDIDGDTPYFATQWLIDGVAVSQVNPPFTVGQQIQCTATIFDDESQGNTLTTEAVIQNTPPLITNLEIHPNIDIEANTTLQCIGSAEDIDEQSLVVSYEWTNANTLLLSNDPTLTLSSSSVSPGDSITCTMTVVDESGATISNTTSVLVENTEPVFVNIPTITGNPSTGDTLSCSATIDDLNDGSITPTFQWTTSIGTPLSTTNTWTVDTNEVSPLDTVLCTVSGADSNGATVSDTTSILIQNTPPMVQHAEVANSTPYTNTDLNLTLSMYDGDGQPLTAEIEWHVVDENGADTIAQTNSSISFSSDYFVKNQTVYAVITPFDGLDYGTSFTTASVIIQNSSPSSPSIVVTPKTANIDSDTLECNVTVESTDIDNDTIEYMFEWTTSDGTILQSTNTTSLIDMLSAGILLSPDTITCSVTPFDGTATGPTISSDAEVIFDCNCPSVTSQDYAYTYWPENFRYPNFNAHGFHTTRHFITGHYGLTMDMTTGSILNLGQAPIVQTMDEAAYSSDDWVNTALSVEVEYGIEVNGVNATATDFINPDETGTHSASNPSMLMDMGRFVQHIEIPEVMYTGNSSISGSLGIVSAPQHFVLTHRIQSSTDLTGTITITTTLGGDLFTQVQDFQYLDGTRVVEIEDTDGVHWLLVAPNTTDAIEQQSDGTIQVSRNVSSLNTGTELSIPILIAPSEYMTLEQMDFYIAPEDIATVSYAQMNQSDTFTTGTQTALWNHEFGCFEINLGSIQGSGAAANSANWHNGTDFNIYNRHQITVEHSSSDDLHIPLFFDGPINTTFNITGGAPLFRSINEEPTGVPIQVSKNWHIPGYWPNWFHMYSTPTFPAGSHPFELTVAIGKWGETFAASHAQLSLVGWGTNQQWDESALGAWGESITYDPDKTLRRAMVDDVRPFLMEVNGQYNWTGNVGGADFLKYRDASNQEQQPIRLKSTYNAPGPVMTDVVYSGTTADEAIQFSAQTHLVRTDDIVRAYYVLQYDFLEDVEYTRLGLFQIAADNYSDNGFTKYAYGDSTGVLFDGTVPNHNTTGYTSNSDRGIELTGEHPWVFMYDSTKTGGNLPEHVADVGFIVRDYNATINGTNVSNPHINIQRTRNGGWSQMAFELGVPFDASDTLIEAGSSIQAVVEYVVVPNDMTLYYGTSTDLLGVDSTWFGTTDIIEHLASSNAISANATIGTVLQEHPTIIEGISEDIAAEFELIGGFGYSPITISGLFRPDGWQLEAYDNGNWIAVDQSVHDNDYWQTSFDPESETYSLTFSVETNGPTTFRLSR